MLPPRVPLARRDDMFSVNDEREPPVGIDAVARPLTFERGEWWRVYACSAAGVSGAERMGWRACCSSVPARGCASGGRGGSAASGLGLNDAGEVETVASSLSSLGRAGRTLALGGSWAWSAWSDVPVSGRNGRITSGLALPSECSPSPPPVVATVVMAPSGTDTGVGGIGGPASIGLRWRLWLRLGGAVGVRGAGSIMTCSCRNEVAPGVRSPSVGGADVRGVSSSWGCGVCSRTDGGRPVDATVGGATESVLLCVSCESARVIPAGVAAASGVPTAARGGAWAGVATGLLGVAARAAARGDAGRHGRPEKREDVGLLNGSASLLVAAAAAGDRARRGGVKAPPVRCDGPGRATGCSVDVAQPIQAEDGESVGGWLQTKASSVSNEITSEPSLGRGFRLHGQSSVGQIPRTDGDGLAQ
mmetsp:Transcript_5261/g.16698  ORF Transcript_5261/g.16698 Transcript_5261/m.16698 type:complete len:418 (-) Transcript_5261:13-1266(-)